MNLDTLKNFLQHPWAQTLVGVVALLLIAWLAGVLIKRVLLRAMRAISRRTHWRWDDALLGHGVFTHAAQIVPALLIAFGIVLVPGVPDTIQTLVRNVAIACTIAFVLLAISASLNAINDLYARSDEAAARPIKGYLQLVKIVLFLFGAILIIATLVDRSPMLFLSGLGAMTAVLLLVFKDTILSLVASVQLTTNDMLRVGDWIAMPQFNADGDVIDIALHTVKVRNFDKTITTIPTWKLISESFINWRGMQQTGGRRIKRALHLDAGSVRFLDDDEFTHLRRSRLLEDYLLQTREDARKWNSQLGDSGKLPINQRRMTNLGTFRAYAEAYLKAHPDIHDELACMVRLLDPGVDGIPVEIYCFTTTTVWTEYERIQGDVFDHLITILPEFGLSLYQRPAGSDVRALLDARKNGEAEADAPVQRRALS